MRIEFSVNTNLFKISSFGTVQYFGYPNQRDEFLISTQAFQIKLNLHVHFNLNFKLMFRSILRDLEKFPKLLIANSTLKLILFQKCSFSVIFVVIFYFFPVSYNFMNYNSEFLYIFSEHALLNFLPIIFNIFIN